MIVTVTMNPAIDKTVDVEGFEAGGLNRIKRMVSDAGGKGINVSKTICKLGGKTVATGLIGGSAGRMIVDVLNNWGIENDFVTVNGETRTNTKIVDPEIGVTELNEPGPVVSLEEINELLNKLEGYAEEGTLFVLSGSIPAGVNKDIYKIITEKVHAKGAKVLLDADGDLFTASLDAVPDMIKPNRDELERYFGLDYRPGQEELIQMGRQFLDRGIGTVNISLGQMGALFLSQEKCYKSDALSVNVHSTVGAGDAMVAAMAYGWEQGMSMEENAKLSVATSAGAVTTIGTKPPERELVDELFGKVVLKEIG